jgi:hypothetical protein
MSSSRVLTTALRIASSANQTVMSAIALTSLLATCGCRITLQASKLIVKAIAEIIFLFPYNNCKGAL